MQNPIVVRLSAAEVQQLSDHLATALIMYHLAPAPTPKDAPHGKDQEDVRQALLYLDDGSDGDDPRAGGRAIPVLELYDLARIIERATRSPYPWPGSGGPGERADVAAFAAALRARCHDAVTRQSS